MADRPEDFLAQEHGVSKPAEDFFAPADIDDLADYQLRLEAAVLYELGKRPTVEFILEVAREYIMATPLLAKLRRYNARLTLEMLAVTGGDRMPAAPIHLLQMEDDDER